MNWSPDLRFTLHSQYVAIAKGCCLIADTLASLLQWEMILFHKLIVLLLLVLFFRLLRFSLDIILLLTFILFLRLIHWVLFTFELGLISTWDSLFLARALKFVKGLLSWHLGSRIRVICLLVLVKVSNLVLLHTGSHHLLILHLYVREPNRLHPWVSVAVALIKWRASLVNALGSDSVRGLLALLKPKALDAVFVYIVVEHYIWIL
jgi:hypothetical protein